MAELNKILKEIKVRPKSNLIKGKVYDIKWRDSEKTKFKMEYNGQNVHGDHLFFYALASEPSRMDWTYISPKDINKYIITRNKDWENITEIGKKPITKIINQDPATGSTTWSVSYKPDLNGLINYMDKLIRKYRDLIKRNNLRDKDIIANYESFRTLRKNLYQIIELRFPELLDKLHK